jgi:hypothetical protein
MIMGWQSTNFLLSTSSKLQAQAATFIFYLLYITIFQLQNRAQQKTKWLWFRCVWEEMTHTCSTSELVFYLVHNCALIRSTSITIANNCRRMHTHILLKHRPISTLCRCETPKVILWVQCYCTSGDSFCRPWSWNGSIALPLRVKTFRSDLKC